MVITVKDYKEIRQMFLSGMSQRAIAKAKHISRNTVAKYCAGESVPWERTPPREHLPFVPMRSSPSSRIVWMKMLERISKNNPTRPSGSLIAWWQKKVIPAVNPPSEERFASSRLRYHERLSRWPSRREKPSRWTGGKPRFITVGRKSQYTYFVPDSARAVPPL